MAITTMDGIVAGLNDAQRLRFYSNSFTSASGFFYNLQNSGNVTSYGQMATPAIASSGGTIHTDADNGFPTLESVVGKRYLAGVDFFCTNTQSMFGIYDRVWSCSGLSGTSTSPQTVVGFPSLPARAGTGEGLEIWVECYVATGATPSNITVNYTNSAGTSGRTSVATAIPTSNPAFRMFRVLLQSGDIGVKSVQSITLSASTGTVGDFGISLIKPVMVANCRTGGTSVNYDFTQTGFPEVPDGSALMSVILAASAVTGTVMCSEILIGG